MLSMLSPDASSPSPAASNAGRSSVDATQAEQTIRAAQLDLMQQVFGLDKRQKRSATGAVVAVLLALVVHGGVGLGAASIPVEKKVERVKMAIYKPTPPPPVQEKAPEPKPEPPKPKPEKKIAKADTKQPKAVDPTPPPPTPAPPPPPNQTPPPDAADAPLVTGISMNSTVSSNTGGPKVRVGNTTYGDPSKEKFTKPQDVQAYAGGGEKDWQPVRPSAISSEASVAREKRVPYPKELAAQNIEGVVKLKVEITKEGKTRRSFVVKSSGNPTIDKLAQEAIQGFLWNPAIANDVKVDSTITYTYRFELVD